jgi:hypothetical protein
VSERGVRDDDGKLETERIEHTLPTHGAAATLWYAHRWLPRRRGPVGRHRKSHGVGDVTSVYRCDGRGVSVGVWACGQM